MLACATEGMPPEAVAAVEAQKGSYQQMCDGFKQAGMTDYIGKAMEACKDTACGAGGADWTTCVTTKMTEAMTAAAGAAAVTP
jgi:hypothetical protein